MSTTTRYTIADTATDARSADLGVDLTANAFASEDAADSALAALEDATGLAVRELRYSDLVGDELVAAERMVDEIAAEHGVEAAGAGSTGEWTVVPEASWDDLMERLGARFGVEKVSGYGRTGRDIARRYLAAFNAAIEAAA